MIKNENIVCISSIDWDFIWQGHQEIMSTFARAGNPVLFIENTGARTANLKDLNRLKKRFINWRKGIGGIRKVGERIYVLSPLVFPFPYSRIFRCINKHILLSVLRRWVKSMKFSDVIFWTYLPTDLSLDIMESLDHKLIVYCCIDNLQLSSREARKIAKPEGKVIKKSDLVFVSGKNLYDHCRRYRNSNIYLFREGVNLDNSAKAYEKTAIMPKDLGNIPKPIVGYIGAVHKWIDQELIRYLAYQLPECSFVFVGPVYSNVSSLKEIKNVYFLGRKEIKKIPSYIKEFKIGIIPYLIRDYTNNVYPTKLNEYLSLGKPVVSTNLPEVKFFNREYGNIVEIGDSKEEFSKSVRKLLMNENSISNREKRFNVARDNSWSRRIEKMSEKMQEAIQLKKIQTDKHWSANLIKIYRKARRKVAKALIYVTAFYLIVFYTPFIWFLARPLSIFDLPQKTDAIVVFAGGVGESGKAGQGYEERVQYAVELYKKGYARNMIFSSGYMYAFKEPLVMKALAVSLSVPEEAIILEDKAKNTYENVGFTMKILAEKGWDEILLVSSPYHMRRVELVYKKIAPGISVTLTPVPNSLFYGNEEKVEIKHIRAIIHEYLGIIYYFWKRYI